jgi:putative acetyltransferase
VSAWRIVEGGLSDPRVIALVEHHAASARAATPGGTGHSFFIDRLRAPDIRFFTAWLGDEVAGIGALKTLSVGEGEVKSMHTAAGARGQGIGSAVLATIVEAARSMGMTRLSLETHPGPHFASAIALYRRNGFGECPPFGDYVADPASLFMTREL